MIKSNTGLVALAVLLCSLSACAAPQVADDSAAPGQNRRVILGQQSLTLENDQMRCVLRKPDQSVLPLEMPWPCEFTVDPHGKAHVETYEGVPIVIVLHITENPSRTPKCLSEYRAVRLISGQLEPSVIGRSSSCLRGAGDQKDYTGLFPW